MLGVRDRGARTDQLEEKMKNRKEHQSNLTKKINEEAVVSHTISHCVTLYHTVSHYITLCHSM